MVEPTDHVIVECPDSNFGFIAKQVRNRLLIVDGLVRDVPAVQKKVVLIIVQKGVGKCAFSGQNFELDKVCNSGIDITARGFAPRLRGLRGYKRNLCVVAQLDQRRMYGGNRKGPCNIGAELFGGLPTFLGSRVHDP